MLMNSRAYVAQQRNTKSNNCGRCERQKKPRIGRPKIWDKTRSAFNQRTDFFPRLNLPYQMILKKQSRKLEIKMPHRAIEHDIVDNHRNGKKKYDTSAQPKLFLTKGIPIQESYI